MKRWSSWFRGGTAALVLLGPGSTDAAVSSGLATSLAPIARDIAPPVESAPQAAPEELGAIDPFPGQTYGNLGPLACLIALEERKVPYERRGHARGVDTPVRLVGPMHGVLFQHADTLQEDWQAGARREVLDCRLVLALDDLAIALERRGVTKVLHYGVYRGDLPLPKQGPPRHHVAGLAIDVAGFVMGDTRLDVRHDWSRGPRATTCEDDPTPKTPSALALHDILCDVVKAKTFHQVLTPNHDAKHRDHFHLEVMRETSWTMVE